MKKQGFIVLVLALLLAGCGGGQSAASTATAEFFLTAESALTEVAQVTSTPQPTWTASATATDFQLTSPSPAATTRVPFFDQATATPRVGGISCDDASFIKDVTIPDNTVFGPGEAFTKTWRLRNDGSCAWTQEYDVAFVSGNQLEGKTTSVPRTIGINETLDISVEMKAPLLAGSYSSYWTIRNEDGISFGDLFYVEIEVSKSATETYTPTVKATGNTPTVAPTVAPATTTVPPNTATSTSTPTPTNTPTPTATFTTAPE